MSKQVQTDRSVGAKVLVIDDSNTIRRSAEIFLKQGGYEVLLAEDGFDALSKVNDHDPHLIFCDILMPRLDGYQTCAIIKRNPKVLPCAGHHVVVQGWPVRQGTRPHGWLRGLPHQTLHERPTAWRRRALSKGGLNDNELKRRECPSSCQEPHASRNLIRGIQRT